MPGIALCRAGESLGSRTVLLRRGAWSKDGAAAHVIPGISAPPMVHVLHAPYQPWMQNLVRSYRGSVDVLSLGNGADRAH